MDSLRSLRLIPPVFHLHSSKCLRLLQARELHSCLLLLCLEARPFPLFFRKQASPASTLSNLLQHLSLNLPTRGFLLCRQQQTDSHMSFVQPLQRVMDRQFLFQCSKRTFPALVLKNQTNHQQQLLFGFLRLRQELQVQGFLPFLLHLLQFLQLLEGV